MVKRFKIQIQGTVQGVGFRPFVYRIAKKLNLSGFVQNDPSGATIEIEGKHSFIKDFLKKLKEEKPYLVHYHSLILQEIPLDGEKEFRIISSESQGEKKSFILPDIGTCPECISEIFESNNRRFKYPFTNCTLCGPRFSIIENLPYDRKNTSMKIFKMCDNCKKEYENSENRRFHAQPNACPECGPDAILWNKKGGTLKKSKEAIIKSAKIIKKGEILALKGLGGFQLLVDARNEEAVLRLRRKKHREEKPFAVMFPNLNVLKEYAILNFEEEKILKSYQCPIILLRKGKKKLADSVSPYNSYIGVMLPYTPLHHILIREINFPVVCTSGNISEEPMLIDERSAMKKLSRIADYFLIHIRPIVRPVDDSVVRIIKNREIIIRRARGYAPLPIITKENLPPILAVGAHLKNTISISKNNKIFISQHIGDMKTEKSYALFTKTIQDFKRMYEIEPEIIACDAHPEYITTKYAKSTGLSLIKVYHHHAHIASCMLDNNLEEDVLGVSWDGTGFGEDGTIWGGEFLIANYKDFKRVASFNPFSLIGGEKAIKEPKRSLLSILYEIYKDECFELNFIKDKFNDEEIRILKKMLKNKINLFQTSSAGRLFDALASLLNLKQISTFEGQAPMILEGLVLNKTSESYPFSIEKSQIFWINWIQTFLQVIKDIKNKISPEVISTKFHNTLVQAIVKIAKIIKLKKVVLSGGCFQNAYLTKRAIERLRQGRFEVFIHNKIPPNDGGISPGQLIVAARKLCA